MTLRLTLLAALISLFQPGTAMRAQAGPASWDRAAITARIEDLRKISTPEGIEVLEPVQVGGTTQWISIRGQNRANPVLLMIHGGPAWPMMPTSWAWQKPWEDFFTVVQWDQRGSGKNAVTADSAALAPTLSVDRMVRDAEEVVEYLRKRLGKEKIVVLGYSWGTVVGALLAQKRPDLLHAYVGMGQSVSIADERVIYDRVLAEARRARNTRAVRELESLEPYPGPNPRIEALLEVRKWAREYNGGWYGRKDFDLFYALPQWAPEYTAEDILAQFATSQWIGSGLVQNLAGIDLGTFTAFKVPVIFLMGRHYLHTPYQPVKVWYDRITAPHKRFVTFERSAHFMMFEEPGRLLLTLVNEVLPLAGGSPAFAPEVP
jgi:pimeloyl-ACP methyl ester carboxylesterase